MNLKITNISFQVFTGIKTLNSYTNDANVIFDAAKNLLLNEIHSSNFKLHLVGVRVSALIDELKNKNFFTNTYNSEFDENDDIKTDLLTKCPICGDYFDGNEDYIQQHIELCMFN